MKANNQKMEERVVNVINQVMASAEPRTLILSTETVVKILRAPACPEKGLDDPSLEVYYLEDDGGWEHCMSIHWPSERNRRFLAAMVMSVDF